MAMSVYMCSETGEIAEAEFSELPYPTVSSQFCIVFRYDLLYEKEMKRFAEAFPKNTRLPYGLPSKSKVMREYNGLDRDPLYYTPDDFHLYTKENAVRYLNSLSEKDQLELIFIRVNGSNDSIPDGLSMLGFDVGFPFSYGYGDGFSAICDCMFLARWHGCDIEGTEFSPEYEKLNSNGLFDNVSDAYDYMLHYLNQEWSERGDFCIYEIYR